MRTVENNSILVDIESNQFLISWNDPNKQDSAIVKKQRSADYDPENEFDIEIDSMAEYLLNAVKSGIDVLNADYIESINILMKVSISCGTQISLTEAV